MFMHFKENTYEFVQFIIYIKFEGTETLKIIKILI